MKTFARSDIGRIREMNQDNYFISDPNDEIKMFIVADGMGGYKGGEVASALAIESAKSYIKNNFEETNKDKDKILDLIKNAIEYANMVVYERSKEVEELNGMGTTLDVLIIQSGKVYIGHVGDSRVYRLRKDFFRKLTTDHSYVEQLVREGNITKEEAYNHPKKNMLTKALGCTAFVEPDVMVKGFQKDDILLMCTDGLTNMVREDVICDIIKDNPETACEVLVNKANENGGQDNITAVIIL
ncbi:MAG: Stp1/IreP family PP2C-type Ser/Thr phosphatase [Clostridia bacterium]|nr:Stp1/IreP family PP2C-type Ser/Thr phosphatase [Clostridia bacterium]